MKSNTCTQTMTRPTEPQAEAQVEVEASAVAEPTAAELEELVACVRSADRALARATALAGRLAGSGVCEHAEGLPLEQYAGLAARMTHGDARMLVTAGQVLHDLPVVAALFRSGDLGWGQVRAIVCATRPLSRANRRLVDERVAATVASYEAGAGAFDPDGLVWAVDDAVDELRPRQTERAERRAAQGSFLSRQMDFDGGMRCYGQFDPVSAAVINNAIDAKMGGRPPAGAGQAGRDPAYTHPDTADGVPGDGDSDAGHGDGAGSGGHGDERAGEGDRDRHGDGDGADGGGGRDGAVGGWSSTLTGRAAAQALVGLCADALGGVDRDGTPRPARPLFNVHVDLSQVSANPSGTIELNLRGPLPRIGAATLERLAGDADLRAVLFDQARPLATSRKLNLQDICEKTRIAVLARDLGCRFPGSPDPAGFTDIDHLHERERGGDHHPDNLALLSRRFHRIRHRHGWTLTLEPATGMLTIARGKRRFHSLPNGTRLARPPDTRPTSRPAARGHPGEPDLPF